MGHNVYIVTRYERSGGLGPVVRDADSRCFTMVMATGIVSVAPRLAGSPDLSLTLLWVGIVAFAVLVVASAWRVVAFGRDMRAELRRPDRMFSYFAFPAAASMLGTRLAGPGPAGAATALGGGSAVAR